MRSNKPSTGLIVVSAIITATLLVTGTYAVAQQETVLLSFNGIVGGSGPLDGLIFDAVGNLYGTTNQGGAYAPNSGGTVFQLTPKPGGGWTENVIHSFGATGDGTFPSAGLVVDASGNLYGTTPTGGAYNSGTVFELKPTTSGWTELILHDFNNNGSDGYNPSAGLIFDNSGNLYGTTRFGGPYTCGVNSCGTVFELTPQPDGRWTEKILHNFGQTTTDGYQPLAGLIFDAAGNLYGTTYFGGTFLEGTVFELTRRPNGTWLERIPHHFNANGHDGFNPAAGLILDGAGNLYGTTYQGGTNLGTVFELTPKTTVGWTETILHTFGNKAGTDGFNPVSGLVLDSAGNLYGTTPVGGANNVGIVFKLTPAAGSWTETVLHTFSANGTDGYNSYAGLVSDSSGNLYGTTNIGGTVSDGTVFEITP
ncbi:MAG TPA: choice-of-anchor tandem repeat GloVer-containing protein [Candidatus Acidoferrum sp.]|jgi:uncharacterized repeat protein (TIGR03803 family)|nr:choice-of-anchor tandem repeat GloVer-containing protein [Candidatus Acidoferrum sp.]